MDDTRAWQTDQRVQFAEVTPGTRVVGTHGQVGRVSDMVPDAADIAGGVRVMWADGTQTFVPLSALERRGDVLALRAERAGDMGATRRLEGTHNDADSAETIRVPVIEERLTADTVWRDAGTVRLRVRAEAVPQTVTREVAHEEVYVEEVAIGRELAEGERPGPRQEGEVLVIPIVEEEIVVFTRRVLTREVRITRRMARGSQTVDATTRHTVVEIDAGDLADRVHLADGRDAGPVREDQRTR